MEARTAKQREKNKMKIKLRKYIPIVVRNSKINYY